MWAVDCCRAALGRKRKGGRQMPVSRDGSLTFSVFVSCVSSASSANDLRRTRLYLSACPLAPTSQPISPFAHHSRSRPHFRSFHLHFHFLHSPPRSPHQPALPPPPLHSFSPSPAAIVPSLRSSPRRSPTASAGSAPTVPAWARRKRKARGRCR